MPDGVAVLAILARVRRRLRALAAFEGAFIGAALALAATAIAVAAVRWRGAPLSPRGWRFEIGAAVAIVALGALAGALRRIPFDRCARFVDGALDGAGTRCDRVLSALAFTRMNETGATAFMRAAMADAAARASDVAPRAAAPFRRPRATPAFAAAAVLLGVGALSPLPARGSRAPTTAALAGTTPARADTARVHLPGPALDAERDEVAAALRAARELRDTELAGVAQALAATVADLTNRGLAPADALDRLTDLLRRADEDAADLAGLPHALDQAGKALQATAATRESGTALAAEDGEATQRALSDLADRAAAATDGERNRIAASLDRASDGVRTIDDARRTDGPASGMPEAGQPTSTSGSSGSLSTGATDSQGKGGAGEPNKRRLSRDQAQSSQASSSQSTAAGGPRERRLQRLQRELNESAAACRTNPEACRHQLQRQSRELPRMEDEARSLGARQRLAEAVRQLRERLRREGGGAGERGRDERRFLRSARGENARVRPASPDDGENPGAARALAEDPDGIADEGDDMDGTGGDGDTAGESAPSAGGSEGSPSEASANAGQGADGQDSANGDGIGNQRGNDPLGARGPMTTRGRAHEAAVKNGAGPTRSQVIQSAAKRGFAHTNYQSVFTDYQAVVEESLDGSAVPPGRRYIVRRYFQLIRPQSTRAPQSAAATR